MNFSKYHALGNDREAATAYERVRVFHPKSDQAPEALLKASLLRRGIGDVAAETVVVRWRDASLVLGLSGLSGLKEVAVLRTNGGAIVPFSPSLGFPATSATDPRRALTNHKARAPSAAERRRTARKPCPMRRGVWAAAAFDSWMAR